MLAQARRARSTMNIWPGFVDALATLLMVIIFLLMIFVVAQFYLNDALIGRDKALDKLNQQVLELAELLSLERRASRDLRNNVAQISAELQSSLAERDNLSSQLNALLGIRDNLETAQAELAKIEKERERLAGERTALTGELEETYKRLEEANKTISVDKETIEVQLAKLAALQQDIVALQALRDELSERVAAATRDAESKAKSLSEEQKISQAAKAQVALLNRQLAALRRQVATLNEALEASEARDKEAQVKIANLGQRLNAALASKVQELARYRSEFFGRLHKVLGNRRDIQIVGDRFVFQSEVLFASGSDILAPVGKLQMAKLGETLKEITATIPSDINWILRVDGHTDRVPIRTKRFPSNWELSAARAISVVKFLTTLGIPANRFAAAGFGEFQPLDVRNDEFAYRRNRRIELKLDQR
ncbi:MAG: peptidoglycan -binding protein [Rhodospirillaceae bacterium]|nr:peptidoglycan -binding protein [Rhodospirillaceae bacterium]MDD9924503.1 peptidoglycan -binding protein [Rhodospirillaceae bacterium]